MIILADESVDAPVIVRLRNDGHTVESVAVKLFSHAF